MNRTNARIAQLAAVVAVMGTLGLLNANPVNYYSGYSQPSLLAAAAPSDAFGTQNVSFVQTPAPVQNIYQSATAPATTTAAQPAPTSPAYTSSYFQSTSAATSSSPAASTSSNSTAAPASAFATASAVSTAQAGSQTQTLAYASYMQATTSTGPQTTSGPSQVTAAYVSAFGTPALSPIPNVSVPSNPLGVSYFQVASALSPLNIAPASSPSRPTQVMTPFGPRMIDIYNPEPGTIALIGGGLGLLLILRRRILAR